MEKAMGELTDLMTKTHQSASELPGQYRQLARYFANPHSLIYEPLDVFYDFLVKTRVADDERLHDTPTHCACMVCRAKAGQPGYVQPLYTFTRDIEPEWLLWGDDRYVITDAQGCPITGETPCMGKAQDGCPCYWCRPYHYDNSITNRQALKRLMDFIAPMVPVVRGRRLEQEKAALLTRLARVEQDLRAETCQPDLL
jgi:hypothetical protein